MLKKMFKFFVFFMATVLARSVSSILMHRSFPAFVILAHDCFFTRLKFFCIARIA